MSNTIRIISVDSLLRRPLVIPDYQRPYKWTARNIIELMADIRQSIEDSKRHTGFKYRIGTVILYKNPDTGELEIVDGQQRLLSFSLLKLYLQPDFKCKLIAGEFNSNITQKNLHDNYWTICETLSVGKDIGREFSRAMKNILEFVVITVETLGEAFQLFDSQNSRGRALFPHDLLKAYHLREIKDKYEMEEAVQKWEIKDPKQIRMLFDRFLFPILNWSNRRKCNRFTAAQIDAYKGVDPDATYTYARRVHKSMPYFQITEPYMAGAEFFEMVDHYMKMLQNVKREIMNNPDFVTLRNILADKTSITELKELDEGHKSSIGFCHARNLFWCGLLCYYDRFHNFDVLAVTKLFTWAMMIRVDMNHLGFDTINRYALGWSDNNRYTMAKAMFTKIVTARRHNEISSMKMNLIRDNNTAASEAWNGLYHDLRKLNGYE